MRHNTGHTKRIGGASLRVQNLLDARYVGIVSNQQDVSEALSPSPRFDRTMVQWAPTRMPPTVAFAGMAESRSL
jgi:hypothetical protein